MRKVHCECAAKEGQETSEKHEAGCASPTKRAVRSVVVEAPTGPNLLVPPQAVVRVRSVPLARSRVMHVAIGQPVMLPTASMVQPAVQLGAYAAPIANPRLIVKGSDDEAHALREVLQSTKGFDRRVSEAQTLPVTKAAEDESHPLREVLQSTKGFDRRVSEAAAIPVVQAEPAQA